MTTIRRPVFALAILCAAFAVSSGVARAASIGYTMQIGGQAQAHAIALDGDSVTTFRVSARPTSCTAGNPSNSSDSEWVVSLTAPVPLTAGAFHFSGQAPSAYYDNGPGDTASYSVAGTVSVDHRLITGTVTITNGNDPFLQGCSASIPFLAVPTVADTRGPANAHATYQSQFLTFDYHGGVVSDLRLQANIRCGVSVDAAEVTLSDYGLAPLHTDRSGRFGLATYVLDEYGDILRLTVTGTVSAKTAHGRIAVTEPAGLTGVAGVACSAGYGWTAARPTPPPPPGPEAFFQWDAVRVPAGAAYHYYFYVSALTCANGATAVALTVGGRHFTVTCHAGGGWASGPLSPGTSYQTTATPVRLRGRRVIKRGTPVTQSVAMPGAGDIWQPIGSLPGAPPA